MDESRFTVFSPGCVYRRRGERLAEPFVDERDRFWVGSAMVWRGLAHGVKLQLYFYCWPPRGGSSVLVL